MSKTTFSTSSFPGRLSIRWLNANCYEIKLPNGKTILTDPFIPDDKAIIENWRKYNWGFSVKDLEGADYILIGHPHGDHIGSVMDVYDRFGSIVLCHSAYAIHMVNDLLIPQQMIFPFDNNQHYEFGDFTLDTSVAHHICQPNPKRPEIPHTVDRGTKYETLNLYGPLFNTNFIITTENNVRLGFCAGTFENYERNRWKNAKINILLRQCTHTKYPCDPEAVAKELIDSGAEIMIPIHHEGIYGTDIMEEFANQINAALQKFGYSGRFFCPERGKWYKVGISIGLK